MNQDEIFDKEVCEAQIEGLRALKSEVKVVEKLIEKMLSQLLECTSSIAERDFNACSL
jgi:hypothetical protein